MKQIYVHGLGQTPDSWNKTIIQFCDSLQKVSCPTLVICGEKDTANKRASVELADLLANAELQVLSEIGHEVNIEAPKKLADVLRKFYNRVE